MCKAENHVILDPVRILMKPFISVFLRYAVLLGYSGENMQLISDISWLIFHVYNNKEAAKALYLVITYKSVFYILQYNINDIIW